MSASRASFDLSSAACRSQQGSFDDSSTPVIAGKLFKERDHFRGWRERYFVLDKNFLHYYLQADDVTPRNTLQLVKGVEITGGAEKVNSRGNEYYTFNISHPQLSTPYRLSSVSKESCLAWVAALRSVVAGLGETRYLSPVTDDQRLLKRDSEADPVTPMNSSSVSSAPSPVAPVNSAQTLSGIPKRFAAKVETAALALLQGAASDAEGWVPMFEKPGVAATRRAGSGGAICVRGETVMPYTPAEIYGAFSGAKSRLELDNQLQDYQRKEWTSFHTGIEYLRFKPVWPTAARDFCNLTHWRLLEDGTLLAFAFSAPFGDMCPQESGLVRADLIIGGYVMRPVVGGTQVHIIVQTDLCGSIPASVASFAAQSQPMVLIALRKRLDALYSSKSRPKFTAVVRSSYEDVLAVQKMNKDASFPDLSKKSVPVSSPTDASSSTPPNLSAPVGTGDNMHGVPQKYVEPLNSAVKTMLAGAASDAEGWEPMFEKPGVVATRRAGSGRAICVRGETVLPFTVAEIFACSSTAQARKELDSQLQTYTRVKWFSRQTGIEYMRFKPVWPTAARDFCNLTHWRLLEDGTFVTLGFSTPFPDLCPEVSGCVRANLILAGYVMKPVVGGTQIHIIVQTDLGGSLPASIANMAAQDQPMTLVKLRKRLEKIHSDKDRPTFQSPITTNYSELISVSKMNKDAQFPDEGSSKAHSEQHNDRLEEADRDLVPLTSEQPVLCAEELPTVIKSSQQQASTNILTLSNCLLLVGLPAGTFYSLRGHWYVWLLVLISIMFAVEKVMGRHLGTATRRVVVSSHCVPCGKYLFKFSADMNRLAAHGSKHSNLSGKDAVRAVIVKASSKALHAVPSVCGHIINGYFYPCANRGVSLIVPLSTSMRSGAISINNADSLSTRQIANVIKQETASVNVDCSVSGFPAKFPFWVGLISNSYVEVCSRLRMTLPGFGGNFPGGVIALLIASDSSGNTLEGKSRQRVEEALILDGALAAAPISVCIGQPTAAVDLSNRKDLQVRNECVVTVTLDTRLAAAAQCEQFAEKMILYLSTPTLLDA